MSKRKVLCPKIGKRDFEHIGLTGDGYKISSSYLDLLSFQSSLYFPTFVVIVDGCIRKSIADY